MSTAESRTQTHWIHLPQGRLFAQSWSPAQPGGSAALAPLVLLHDSLGCVAMWRDLPAQLAQATGRTVYAYDRLGYGQSDAVSEPPGLGFVAAEAEHSFPSVREQLGLERYALLGHSVGSGMALEIAARAGDACEAVVTIAGQAFVEEHTRSGIRVAREQFQNPEHLARLTERFYRVDKARSRHTGGSGLGLAIVKHALSHHDAHLDIESRVGAGSRFSFLIPARMVLVK